MHCAVCGIADSNPAFDFRSLILDPIPKDALICRCPLLGIRVRVLFLVGFLVTSEPTYTTP